MLDAVLKLQDSEELDILDNQQRVEHQYTWKIYLGGVLLETNKPRILYDYGLGRARIEVLEGDTEFRDRLRRLQQGVRYRHRDETYRNGELVSETSRDVVLKRAHARLLTNEPPRWEIVMWLEKIPLTFRRAVNVLDSMVEDVPNINSASVDDIVGINQRIIRRETAEAIVQFRLSRGMIRGLEDLRRVSGITEEEVQSIAELSRAED